MSFRIKIAGVIVKINPRWELTKNFFKDYLYHSLNKKYDFVIQITDEELKQEALTKKIEEIDSKSMEQLFIFENWAILRVLTNKLIDYNVLLMHGSAISYKNKAYIFIAPSGTGKSTHTKLWKDNLKNKIKVINDDKPFIKLDDEDTYAYGSPWSGKHNLNNNIKRKLGGICFLVRGETNSIERINDSESIEYLYRQIFRPEDPIQASKSFEQINRIISRQIPIYRMSVNNYVPDAFETSFSAMVHESVTNKKALE